MPNPISLHSQIEHADILAHYIPNGPLFASKGITATPFRQFLLGLAIEMRRDEQALIDLYNELDPSTCDLLIENWEQEFGIPDDCFPVAATLAERRLNIFIKRAGVGAQTQQDFIDLAALFGIVITISKPNTAVFPPYDVAFLPTSEKNDKFTWIILGDEITGNTPPYDVPFTPQENTASTMTCFFDKLKPSFTLLLFQNT